MRKLLVVAALLPALMQAAEEAPQDRPGPRERVAALMGVGTFEAAGLDQLSEQELQVLEAWLSGRLSGVTIPMSSATVSYVPRGQAAAAGAAVASTAGYSTPAGTGAADRSGSQFGLDQQGGDEISSRIEGEFNGWRGDTIFRLQNGMVWQQVDGERLVVGRPAVDPAVTIERGFFGYRMEVEGFNQRVQVRRIE